MVVSVKVPMYTFRQKLFFQRVALTALSPPLSKCSIKIFHMASRESKIIRCKGAVCWGPGVPLTIEDIEVEAPKASEIRVRMLFASLCHTDITCWNGYPFDLFPRILGHEGVGVVESTGEGVEEFAEGDIVIPCNMGECQDCENCRSGRTNLCLKYGVKIDGLMPDGTSRMSAKGQKLYHLLSCSTFCQFMVVSTDYAVKVDPRVPLPHASLLSCGFTTGFGAVWKEAKIQRGSTVAVFGLGGVGMGAVIGAKLLGASRIIGVDLNENKKEKAELFGMTDFVDLSKIGNKSSAEVVKELTGGAGAEYSFECSGAAAAINEAFRSTMSGRGVTIVVGATTAKSVPINCEDLLLGKTLKGSLVGGIKPRSDLPSIIAKCIHKEIQLDEMVTHQVDLEDINGAFELMKEPSCLKVLIKISEN